MSTATCTKCGASLSDGVTECPQCGWNNTRAFDHLSVQRPLDTSLSVSFGPPDPKPRKPPRVKAVKQGRPPKVPKPPKPPREPKPKLRRIDQPSTEEPLVAIFTIALFVFFLFATFAIANS